MTKHLRYGENPHQKAWSVRDDSYSGPTVLNDPLNGKPISYNNLRDANSALEIMLDFHDRPSCVVVMHSEPCGLATGESLSEAFINAWYGDEVSAFGSIVGYSQKVDLVTAKLLSKRFVEVLVAPEYDEDALAWICKRKKDLRVIATGSLADAPEFTEQVNIRGGSLSQSQDNRLYLCDTVGQLLAEKMRSTEPNSGITYDVGPVTARRFDPSMAGLVEFSILAGKHTKSNAIVLVYEYEEGKYRMLGMGAAQPNRKDSCEKLAATKAKENLTRQFFREKGLGYDSAMLKMVADERFRKDIFDDIDLYASKILSSNSVVLFSDAFFPFRDTVDIAAELGIEYIVQPGGSKRDSEVIDAANEHGIAMIFTGIRKFKH